MSSESLFKSAEACITVSTPEEKVALTHSVAKAWRDGEFNLSAHSPILIFEEPGRPALPELVPPRKLTRRKAGSAEGHAALIHSICHIEFNAINLAWDAVYRFQDMPRGFYDDWVRVADEEALHFTLLQQHLKSLGYNYGDFTAHNGLWESALETAHDPMVRMALVPRVLEARGLDVTPGIIKKLTDIGDEKSVEILNIIHRDEIGHVEAGTRWFRYLCEQRNIQPESTFESLLKQYMHGTIRGPLDYETRKQAGFSDEELQFLESAI